MASSVPIGQPATSSTPEPILKGCNSTTPEPTLKKKSILKTPQNRKFSNNEKKILAKNTKLNRVSILKHQDKILLNKKRKSKTVCLTTNSRVEYEIENEEDEESIEILKAKNLKNNLSQSEKNRLRALSMPQPRKKDSIVRTENISPTFDTTFDDDSDLTNDADTSQVPFERKNTFWRDGSREIRYHSFIARAQLRSWQKRLFDIAWSALLILALVGIGGFFMYLSEANHYKNLIHKKNINLNKMEQYIENYNLPEEFRIDLTDYAYFTNYIKTYNEWSYSGSVYYISSIVSTIGFGFYCPLTTNGKLCSTFFGVVGIPIFLYASFQYVSVIVSCIIQVFDKQEDAAHLHMIALLWVFTFFAMTMLCIRVEGWSFGEAIYFSFQCGTTTALGDIEPEKKWSWIVSLSVFIGFPTFLGCTMVLIESIINIQEAIEMPALAHYTLTNASEKWAKIRKTMVQGTRKRTRSCPITNIEISQIESDWRGSSSSRTDEEGY